MTKLEWSMQCEVNGESFGFDGHGNGDDGLLMINFTASHFPEGFDPVSCPLICNAPASIGFAGIDPGVQSLLEVANGELAVQPARLGVIYDSRGTQLLNLAVSSLVEKKGDKIVVGNQMNGFSRLPELARNLMPAEEYIVPNGPGAAISSIRFSLLTKSGETLTGMTIVPYRWKNDSELPQALVRRYETVDVLWENCSVRTTIRSHVSALSPGHAAAPAPELQRT